MTNDINILQQEIRELERLQYDYIDNDETDEKEYRKISELIKEKYKQLRLLQSIEDTKKTVFQGKEDKKEEVLSNSKKHNKTERIYEPFYDKKLNCNQMIIEVHKAGEWGYENGERKYKEDFSVYNDLVFGLMRLGEASLCLYGLMRYLNDNKHNFNYVLWFHNFSTLTGFKESAYRYALKALFYYGILEPTNRFKRNDQGVCCQVFIFHSDFLVENLPKEAFNKNNKEHLQIAKKNKEKYK